MTVKPRMPEVPAKEVRIRILAAAASLIHTGGPEAATTRAVAAKAAVQVPTIYRLFGDMPALLDAAAEHGLAAYVAAKTKRRVHPDPVEELRHGWDTHVAFGLANPGLFSIMSSHTGSAAAAGLRLLRGRIQAIAAAGRLRTSVERAAAMVHAACVGTVLTLLAQEDAAGNDDLSAVMRETILATITGEATGVADAGRQGAAATLRAKLDQSRALTPGERTWLDEVLARLANEPA